MDVDQVKNYVNRWKAVEALEKEESLAMTIEQRWRKLNAIFGLGISLRLFDQRPDQHKEYVWKRWNLLRNKE
jgi:hypothetical protein